MVKIGTKFKFDQITQFWPNFTISTKVHISNQLSLFCLGQANLFKKINKIKKTICLLVLKFIGARFIKKVSQYQ